MAGPLKDVRNLQFRVEALSVQDGRRYHAIKPDANGYYHNVPITALGITSRNRTYYDVDSFVRQMRDPACTFNELLVTRQLYGEYGHPNVIGMPKEDQFARLLKVQEDRYSHHFSALNTGATLEGGGVILEASVKPHGVFGSYLKESLDDPSINTAFSLRAITEARNVDGVSYRTMKKLVTFDYVGAGGFREASKVFTTFDASQENYDNYDVQLDDVTGMATFTQVALENFTDTELNEIFGAKTICRASKVITFARLNVEDHRQFGTEKYTRDLYHTLIRS